MQILISASLLIFVRQEPVAPVPASEPIIEELDTGVDGMLLDVEFNGEDLGLAVGGTTEGGPSLIARTEDGGRSWTSLPTQAEGRLYGVAFASTGVACAVGYGVLLHTSDAGVTWRPARAAVDALPWFGGIDFVDGGCGFAVGGGERAVLWGTVDGGSSWSDLSTRLPSEARDHGLRAVTFFDAQYGIVSGDEGLLLTTDDAGSHWKVRPCEAGGAWLKGLGFLDRRTGFVVGSQGTVLRPAQEGEAWERCRFPTQDKLNIAGVLDARVGYVGSMAGGLFETRDGGGTWALVREHAGRAIIGSARRGGTPPELWFSCAEGLLLRVRRPD